MKAQSSSLDRISSLPAAIIETILCGVPIEDAVTTSILSREWRYKWTKIPRLKFIEYAFEELTDEKQLSVLEQTFEVPSQRKNMTRRCKFFYAIYQVLLLHQGPIHEFILLMEADGTCVELDHIILHLSRNKTVKKLLISLNPLSEYKLPLSILSFHQLTYLYLNQVHLDFQPTFNGLGCLTRLDLTNVNIAKRTLVHLVSNCPLLKIFCLLIIDEDYLVSDDSTIIELFDSLPVIEHISISHSAIQCFAEDGVPRVLPTTLVHLKSVHFEYLNYNDEYGLPFVGLVIRSAPNLEKLKLVTYQYPSPKKSEMNSVTLEDYSDIWLGHLKEFVIGNFYDLKHELEFVKIILARSPVLKKLIIVLDYEVSKDEEMMLLRNLLRTPHASPLVEIFVERSLLFLTMHSFK